MGDPFGDEVLASIFMEAIRATVRKRPEPIVEARFYPYAGLSSTIRLRQGRVFVRVSDILADSPREVLYALACLLIAKLYRISVPPDHEQVYREYTLRPQVHDAWEEVRQKRGYKITSSPVGRFYDLTQLFAELNKRYFDGTLELPLLSWSQNKTRKVLGHHDHAHKTIVISKTLDDPKIPAFVIRYVLYHEMLHIKHPPRRVGGRTIYHSQGFRADERRFERFDDALKWLDQFGLSKSRKRPGVARRPRKRV